jgi:carboxypeptidase Q
LQPVRVPHWQRGAEHGELIDYAQRPAGVTQRLHLTTLGGSVATPGAGLTAPVLVVRSFAELNARAAQAKGSVVLFDVPFDQQLADNGQALTAYGQAGAYRRQGASAAARVGAVAALVRSVGGANYRLPHTGQMRYEDGVPKIPAAAVSAEDAGLMSRLAQRGPLTIKLILTPQVLPDVDSFNVIADLPGSRNSDEIVLISGHLDSWDLGTGALDDGAGVAMAMGVAQVFKQLKLQPKRTLRVVAWMNEESAGRGAQAYLDANRLLLDKHVAAIESDLGAGRTLGIRAYAMPSILPQLQALGAILQPIGATAVERSATPVSSDIGVLQQAGVPGFEPLLDGRHYFDYHHTAADTLDKVDPQNIQRMVATLSVLCYALLEAPQLPERMPVAN